MFLTDLDYAAIILVIAGNILLLLIFYRHWRNKVSLYYLSDRDAIDLVVIMFSFFLAAMTPIISMTIEPDGFSHAINPNAWWLLVALYGSGILFHQSSTSGTTK